MSNEIIGVPRALLERLDFGKDTARALGALGELRALLAQPNTCTKDDGQVAAPEPVMRLECEKLWGGHGEYAVDFVKPGWLKECREKGGTFLLYSNPPAQAPVVLPEQLIQAIEKEQERLSAEGYLMDSDDCIDVIRDELKRLNPTL